MKARVKATGEIVEVRYSHHSLDCPSLHYYKTQDGSTYKEDSLDFNDTPDYWTRLEHQYAGMAMLGFMVNGMGDNYENIAMFSIKQAHTLVEKLKENK